MSITTNVYTQPLKKYPAFVIKERGKKTNPVRELTRGIRPRVRRIWYNPAASHGVFSNGIKTCSGYSLSRHPTQQGALLGYQSIRDIFCFRLDRTVDTYGTVSVDNLRLKFNNAPLHEKVNLRIYPYTTGGLSEVRFWHKDKLLDVQKVKTELLKLVHF